MIAMATRISKAEARAQQIVRALSTVSEGRSVASNQLGELMKTIAGADAAIQLAADKGWVVIDGDASICLTDEGRQLAKN
jgi:hypothetical protein